MKRSEKNCAVSENDFSKHPVVAEKINKSLDLSIKEGGFASGLSGFGSSYFSPFAIALNASSSQIGVLGALAGLLPGFVQLQSSKLIEKFSRKKVLIISAIFQILILIPIIFSGVLFFYGYNHMAWVAIGLIILFYSIGAIGGPMWFSWMGSLVPENCRGKYFSKRNRVTGFFGLVSLVVGGLILNYFKTAGHILIGFGVLFSIAFILRGISITLLAKQYEPKLKIRKKDYFTFFQFLKKAPETPFGRFAIFITFLWIAIGIGSPFFAVYMLRNLGFSYFWFMIITVSGVLFQLMFLPVIGKMSDKFGNSFLIKISSFLFFLTPFLWVASAYLGLSDFALKMFLVFIPEVFGGFAWAGYNISVNNYSYDSIRKEKRSFGISYLNFMAGIGVFFGGLIGAGLALINISFMNIILFIFAVSGIARLLVVLIGSKYLKEVRHVEHFKSQFIYKEIKPMQGFVRELHHINDKDGKVIPFV